MNDNDERLPDDENDALGLKIIRASELRGFLEAVDEIAAITKAPYTTEESHRQNLETFNSLLREKREEYTRLQAEIKKIAGE